MLDDDVSLKSIFVDQWITGIEKQYLSREKFLSGLYKYDATIDKDLNRHNKIRINIEDSLHFKFLCNPFYFRKYYEHYVNFSNQQDHSVNNFQNLRRNFRVEMLEGSPLHVSEFAKGEYQVIDGFHRLALYYWNTGKKNIPKKYLKGITSRPVDFSKHKIQKRLRKKLQANRGSSFYNSWAISANLDSGYHGFELFGFESEGQRNNWERLQSILRRVKLEGCRILDLGCNTGGVIFHIPSIEFAIGLDFDKKAISAANCILNEIEKYDRELASRYRFECLDLNHFTAGCLTKYLFEYDIDTVFVLSMGSWLSNWQSIYMTLAYAGVDILLETNNDSHGKEEIALLTDLNYQIEIISDSSLDDVTGNKGRKTYFCTINAQACPESNLV